MYNQPGQRSTVNWSTVFGQLTRQRATSASKSASTSAVTQRYVSTRRSSSPARCSGDGRLRRRVFRRNFFGKFSGDDKENSQRWQCGLKEIMIKRIAKDGNVGLKRSLREN